jgi:hypothetical protein
LLFWLLFLSRPSYATPAAEPSLCQRVREGDFQLDDYLIERKGGIQTETDKMTKEKWVYSVKWLRDCECEMTNMENTSDVTKVKIINVTNDAYECVLVCVLAIEVSSLLFEDLLISSPFNFESSRIADCYGKNKCFFGLTQRNSQHIVSVC